MKNLFLILIFIPSIIFGQQVSRWRSSGPSPSSSYRSQSVNPYSPVRPSMERNDNRISNWRSSPPSHNQGGPISGGHYYIPTYPQRYYYDIYGYDYLGWNRWYGWGAPLYGWNYFEPYYYYDRWGYRQPARIYVYKDGKADTVKGVKPNLTFGLQGSTDGQIGLWGRVGNKTYFIFEYNQNIVKDNSQYFPNATIVDWYHDNSMFPLVSDLKRNRSVYLGVGRRIGRTGLHLMVGNMSENVRWRGRDDVGYLTFPKYKDRYMTMKIGAIHDFKNVSLKADVDPIVGNLSLGLGINF